MTNASVHRRNGHRRLRTDEGATAVEYGLMVGLIAAVIVVVVAALGGQLNSAFQAVVNAI